MSMYTETIMWHNQSGHNKRPLEGATHVERGNNPNCGDDLSLEVILENGVIKDAAFSGSGCAISQASMSIMIDLIKDKAVMDAKKICDTYLSMVKGESISEEMVDALEDAQIFEGLSKMPARVKCGTLGWHCLKTVINQL